MRCRLQEIALGEFAALMRDVERPAPEPITSNIPDQSEQTLVRQTLHSTEEAAFQPAP